MGSPLVRSAMPLVGVSLVLAACGGGADATPSTPVGTAVAGLCDARDAAGGGEVDRAEATFLDRSHDEMHRLAAEVAEADRTAAARLLEAKQLVESAFRSDEGAGRIAGLLEDLLAAARGAAAQLDEEVPEC